MKKSDLIPNDATLLDPSKDVKVAKALANAEKKYPHAQTDRIWRHGNKLSVLINCQVPSCNRQRFVHTSDLFQVKTCDSPDHGAKADKKASRTAPKAVRKSKVDRKAAPKAPAQKKGSPRARKANGKAPAPAVPVVRVRSGEAASREPLPEMYGTSVAQ